MAKKYKGIHDSYDVLVVGCGGTGTFFCKEFNRFLAKNKDMQRRINSLKVADGDVVEEKNLDRQCFMPEDIGRNKASVFAEILNDQLEDLGGTRTMWEAIPSYITSMQKLKEVVSTHCSFSFDNYDANITLIISCVDNNGARLLLEEYFNQSDDCFLYDSGNEFATGEVNFAHRLMGKTISPEKSVSFREMKNGDTRQVDEMSCQELNESAPQHFLTNMTAAQHLLRACVNLFTNPTDQNIFERISSQCGFVFFDAFRGISEFTQRIAIKPADKQDKAA